MKITPFIGITSVETERGKIVDLDTQSDLISIAQSFVLQSIRGTRSPTYEGLVAFSHGGNVKFEFGNDYRIRTIEFSKTFPRLDANGIEVNDINIFGATLRDVSNILQNAGVSTTLSDVGIYVPSMGISLNSDNFDEDLDVSFDTLTVSLVQLI